jgi:hypothetical protein
MSDWDTFTAEGARLVARLGMPPPVRGLETVPIMHALLDRIERLEAMVRDLAK